MDKMHILLMIKSNCGMCTWLLENKRIKAVDRFCHDGTKVTFAKQGEKALALDYKSDPTLYYFGVERMCL